MISRNTKQKEVKPYTGDRINKKSINKLREELEEGITNIDTLLNEVQKIKRSKMLIRQCQKFITEQEDEQKSRMLIWRYADRYNYNFEPYHNKPYTIQNQQQLISVSISSRNNWIQEYLDKRGIQIYGRLNNSPIQILNQNNGIIQYQKVKKYQNMGVSTQQIQSVEIKLFCAQNKDLTIKFSMNRTIYNFGNSLVKLILSQNSRHKHKIVLDIRNMSGVQQQSIRRVLVFKLNIIEEQQQQMLLETSRDKAKQSKYQVLQGFYQSFNFVQYIELEAGQYIFMPFPNTILNIYTQKEEQFYQVKQQSRQQIKQLNLMLQGFPQCYPQNINAEFIRQCDLNKGIIIEMYRNVYQNIISFVNQNQNSSKEDKKLMYQSLYSQRYQNYRLRPGEIIIQFYQITQKPAFLYQPKKKYRQNYSRILIDKNEDYEAQTIHAILK